jgi:sugar/nucleoside kinase (ribokinase family)
VILVAGEALVDMTPARCGEAIGYLPRPGGSPYNVAIGLGRLDVPVAFLGRLSTDPFGRLLRGHLEASGVSLAYLVDAAEATTLAFVHLGEEEPEYSFYTASRVLLPAHLPVIPEDAAMVHPFGSVVRDPAVQPVRCPAVRCPLTWFRRPRDTAVRPSGVHPSSVQPSAVRPRPSGRVRLVPHQAVAWGPG